MMSTSSPDGRPFKSTQNIARLGLMLAMAIALSLLEGLLPPLPSPVPIRYGLANIAVMATLIYLGPWEAFGVAVLKSLFVLMTRGIMAGFVSMTGTLLSVLAMIALEIWTRGRVSIFLMSVTGAILHNMGQFLCLVVFLRYQLPLLLIVPPLIVFGIVTGLLSAVLLYAIRKPMQAFFRDNGSGKTAS